MTPKPEWDWRTYRGGIPIDIKTYDPPRNDECEMVIMASCFSRNGAYGCAWVERVGDEFYIQAGSETTGRHWKSPDKTYSTLIEAVTAAQERWLPA